MRYYVIQDIAGNWKIARIGDMVVTSRNDDRKYIFLGVTVDTRSRVRYRTDYARGQSDPSYQNYGITQPASFCNGRIVYEEELASYNITIPANPS